MTDGKALLAAILAQPDEDTPRLMYADWLQEHDRVVRAEFVRLQCERANLEVAHRQNAGDWRSGKRVQAILRRERGLWKHRDPHLLDEFRPCPDYLGWAVAFHDGTASAAITTDPTLFVHRGFCCTVECDADLWLHYGDRFLREQPITRAYLTTWPEVDMSVTAGFCLEGRTQIHLSVGGGPPTVVDMLRAEFPGVEFHLPGR